MGSENVGAARFSTRRKDLFNHFNTKRKFHKWQFPVLGYGLGLYALFSFNEHCKSYYGTGGVKHVPGTGVCSMVYRHYLFYRSKLSKER